MKNWNIKFFTLLIIILILGCSDNVNNNNKLIPKPNKEKTIKAFDTISNKSSVKYNSSEINNVLEEWMKYDYEFRSTLSYSIINTVKKDLNSQFNSINNRLNTLEQENNVDLSEYVKIDSFQAAINELKLVNEIQGKVIDELYQYKLFKIQQDSIKDNINKNVHRSLQDQLNVLHQIINNQ